MFRYRFAAVVFAALLFAIPANAQSIVRTFDTGAGGTLDLRLTAGGDVVVRGGAGEVRVEVTKSGRDADDVDVTFDERSGRVIVRSDYDRRGNHSVRMRYEIRVPSRFNVDLELTGGDVSISDVSGTFSGQTMGGDISLSGLSGRVDMQTMGGEIHLTDSELEGKVHTMGGEIQVTNVQGSVEATTMGGNVTYRGGRASESPVRVETMGGDIEVDDAPSGADLHTMGGDIEAGDIGRFFKANTMGGDIVARSVDGWIEAETMGGDVNVRMVGGTSGDRHVEISSMGGDIQLYVPAGLSMNFDIEIDIEGRTKSASDYVIESDFQLDVSVPQSSRRGDRTRLTAVGSTGGGDNTVRIRTVNGNVRIFRNR